VGVKATHDFTHDTCTFHVATFGPQTHLGHLVQDSALNRLQTVPGIGECSGVDNGVGVFKKTAAHLLADIDIDNPFCRIGR
jgi:hypothetical protein